MKLNTNGYIWWICQVMVFSVTGVISGRGLAGIAFFLVKGELTLHKYELIAFFPCFFFLCAYIYDMVRKKERQLGEGQIS